MSCFYCDPNHPDEIPARFDPNVGPGLRCDYIRHETRRQFFGKMAKGLGGAALASLFGHSLLRAAGQPQKSGPRLPHMAPKAKRAIYLVMAGAPSQLDLFDYKPGLAAQFDRDLPESVRKGQVLTGMSAGQARYPVAPSIYKFKQHGKSGAWVSELLPWTAKIVDEIALIRSMHCEAINHDPAITDLLTGNMIAGKPSIGAWISYGLGSVNENLPTYVVLTSRYPAKSDAQAIFSRLWGSGFLPTSHAGVAFRTGGGDPVLYIKDPPGLDRAGHRMLLDGVQKLNQATYEELGQPEIHARIDQYEMAFRMQTSVPELTDLSAETPDTFELYGPDSRVPGTFAHNCLLARRMAERGVRFTQIFHRGWDSHNRLPSKHPALCADIDRACFALITDLKRRGLLDDTLVVWGGEFGRTVYCQGTLTPTDYGRDHHPKCFTMWAAGGGIKPGIVHGETDDFSYNIVRDPVHTRDLNATLLHQLGLDHDKLTFHFQGLDQKLTGTVPARVVREIIT
jgi:hypothetical protein